MDSESEDIFVSDIDYQFRSLTINNFAAIVNEVIGNENINDGAVMCFQVFYKVTSESIYKNSFNGDYKELRAIAFYINQLREVNKFDSIAFLNCIISEFVTLPLEIVWWLHKNNIVYFLQYCEVMKLNTISDTLLKFISSKKQNPLFVHEVIVKDLLEELIRGSYRPRPGMYRLHRSKTWVLYCTDILNDILNKTLEIIFQENIEQCDNFLYYVSPLNLLPNLLLQKFFRNVLTKMLLHNVDEIDEYSAYTYQQLWHSENINKNLFGVYKEIFSYCNVQDILNILDEFDDTVNWRYTLAAVGVCVRYSPSGSKDIKSVSSRLLEKSFKGGKLKHFLKCLLFIRQGCLEPTMKMDYQTWYSMTFGAKSNFKMKYTATFFKFLISSLITLIPYECKSYLKLQINQALDAPAKCNSLIHDYKGLCRTRLHELDRSPTIPTDYGKVILLHVIEESLRGESVSSTMAKIVRNEESRSIILPQIVKNYPPYTTIRQMLISENYLSEDILNDVPADLDNKVFQD